MSPIRMGKVEALPRAVLAYKDAFNERDVDKILTLISDDCVFKPAKDGITLTGKAEIKEYLDELFPKMGEKKLKGLDLAQAGLHIIFRWELDGKGGVGIFKFKKDLISEIHSYTKV